MFILESIFVFQQSSLAVLQQDVIHVLLGDDLWEVWKLLASLWETMMKRGSSKKRRQNKNGNKLGLRNRMATLGVRSLMFLKKVRCL